MTSATVVAAFVDAAPHPLALGVAVEGQRVTDAADVAGQRQRAMLQHDAQLAHLCAAQQLARLAAAAHGDLIIGGHFKADRPLAVPASAGLYSLSARTVRPRCANPPSRPALRLPIAFDHAAANARLIDRCDHRVGELIGVQDGAAAGRPPHQPVAQAVEPLGVHFSHGLSIAQ